ncbi:MAG TPA: DUF748 domain-containing protein [Candidatus Nitrosotalea sp.]|nr:DUF748 domain-containing protein [Candidatus Nitrosotalea sp.]
MPARRWLVAVSALVALLLVASVVALFFIDEPLRRYTEAKMNASLKGYSVTIGRLHFSPINFSLDLHDTVVSQSQQPDPPVARIERLYASVHWRALLSGRVVGDVLIEHPIVVLNLSQARAEIADPTPVKDKGWQHALQAIYPLKINQLRVSRGDVTYQDAGPFKPLHVSDLEITASNIRNVHSEQGVYPSPMSLRARVFDAGSVSIDGWADFLAEPYAAVMADITLDTIALDYFKPIANRYHMAVERGTLSARGEVQIAPQFKSVKLWSATVDGLRADYVHTPAMAGAAKQATRETLATADRAQDPGLEFRIDRLDIVKSTVGFVNKTTTPSYRVSLADTSVTLTNLSSLPSGETSVAKLQGEFMGSGPASADFKLLPTRPGPDFDLAAQIEEADLRTMNDLLRAHGKFDVVAGRFSLYTELHARNRQITGYVKPLFQDMEVYDPEQDRDKSALKKAYEAVVGGVSKVLQNRRRDEVATRVELSGRLDNPNASIVDTIVGLVQNAFFKAILPGFEAERRRSLR